MIQQQVILLNFLQMMRQMGGLGGGSDSKPNFDNTDLDSDSDDEELPDLE